MPIFECPSCHTRTPHVTGLCPVCGHVGRGREVKPGRPPIDGEAQSRSVLVRLTPEQNETLRAAAKRAGLGLGPWLRSLGLREAKR